MSNSEKNPYKDGFWTYPEFAQKMDVFLELVEAISDRDHFGVQYDPSNAIVAGDDPIALLRAVAPRVIGTHASDRSRDLARFQTEDRVRFQEIDAVTYYHGLQIEDFLRAIVKDRPPLVTGDDGRAVVVLFQAIYQSNREGRSIDTRIT